MKRSLLAAAGIAAVLLLAGCSAPQPEAPSDQATITMQPEKPTAPLAAETPEPTPTTDSAEAAFVAEVRASLHSDTKIPNATDAQILSAGEEACAQLAAGSTPEQVTVIDGETQDQLGYYPDSHVITVVAQNMLCG